MIDAAGYGLSFGEALLTKPVSDGKGAAAVVAQNGDGGIFVELCEGFARDLVHGHEFRAFDVGGCKLPRFAYVEQKRRVFA